MARTSNVFARVEPEVKEQAEVILDQLGIPMSNAIGLFPCEMKLPDRHPLDMGTLSKEQLDREIQKGLDSLHDGKMHSASNVHERMRASMHKEHAV